MLSRELPGFSDTSLRTQKPSNKKILREHGETACFGSPRICCILESSVCRVPLQAHETHTSMLEPQETALNKRSKLDSPKCRKPPLEEKLGLRSLEENALLSEDLLDSAHDSPQRSARPNRHRKRMLHCSWLLSISVSLCVSIPKTWIFLDAHVELGSRGFVMLVTFSTSGTESNALLLPPQTKIHVALLPVRMCV